MDELEQWQYEQAKAWLDYVKSLKNARDRAERMVELMESIADSARGIDYEKVKVAGGQAQDRLAEAIVQLDEMRAQFEANKAAHIVEAQDAMNRLGQLESQEEREALSHHYCGGIEWAEVARMMHFSEARIYEIRKAGVLHAFNVMPNEWRDRIPRADG